MHAFISSNLNYCIALLFGIPPKKDHFSVISKFNRSSSDEEWETGPVYTGFNIGSTCVSGSILRPLWTPRSSGTGLLTIPHVWTKSHCRISHICGTACWRTSGLHKWSFILFYWWLLPTRLIALSFIVLIYLFHSFYDLWGLVLHVLPAFFFFFF